MTLHPLIPILAQAWMGIYIEVEHGSKTDHDIGGRQLPFYR